jgi:hypothetical protein
LAKATISLKGPPLTAMRFALGRTLAEVCAVEICADDEAASTVICFHGADSVLEIQRMDDGASASCAARVDSCAARNGEARSRQARRACDREFILCICFDLAMERSGVRESSLSAPAAASHNNHMGCE